MILKIIMKSLGVTFIPLISLFPYMVCLRWYNDTAELAWKKLKNSKGILAFSYQGESFPPKKWRRKTGMVIWRVRFPNPLFEGWLSNGCVAGLNDCIFTGIKMVGDTYVPAGENSTVISTVDKANTADTINVQPIISTIMHGHMGVGFDMWYLILVSFGGFVWMNQPRPESDRACLVWISHLRENHQRFDNNLNQHQAWTVSCQGLVQWAWPGFRNPK